MSWVLLIEGDPPLSPARTRGAQLSVSKERMSLRIAFFQAKMVDFQTDTEPQNRVFSAKIIDFQIVNEPQNRAFSAKMLDFQIEHEPKIVLFSDENAGFPNIA